MKTTHKLNVRAADIAETRAIAKEAYIYGFLMVISDLGVLCVSVVKFPRIIDKNWTIVLS
jgi:hypothetical protein